MPSFVLTAKETDDVRSVMTDAMSALHDLLASNVLDARKADIAGRTLAGCADAAKMLGTGGSCALSGDQGRALQAPLLILASATALLSEARPPNGSAHRLLALQAKATELGFLLDNRIELGH
jgi:hypothetical protein